MPNPRPFRRVLALLVLATCPTGLIGVHAAQQPGATAASPASAPALPELSLEIRVENLSAEAAPLLRGRLLALEYPVFTCTACKLEQAFANECRECKQALRRDAHPLLRSAAVEIETRTVRCGWTRDHAVHWNDIETQLIGLGLNHDAAKLAIPGDVELVIANARASQVPAVERAVVDAKLFASVTARWDAERREIRIATRAAERPPSREALVRVIQPTGGSLRDLIWPAVPAPR